MKPAHPPSSVLANRRNATSEMNQITPKVHRIPCPSIPVPFSAGFPPPLPAPLPPDPQPPAYPTIRYRIEPGEGGPLGAPARCTCPAPNGTASPSCYVLPVTAQPTWNRDAIPCRCSTAHNLVSPRRATTRNRSPNNPSREARALPVSAETRTGTACSGGPAASADRTGIFSTPGYRKAAPTRCRFPNFVTTMVCPPSRSRPGYTDPDRSRDPGRTLIF